MSEQSNPVVSQLSDHILQMAPHQDSWIDGKLLIDAKAEIERLLRGDFTAEEFQNLCHNMTEDDEAKFAAGCSEYQKKLFGSLNKDSDGSDNKWNANAKPGGGKPAIF